MIFFLLCVFIVQEPATDVDKASVQKMFDACVKQATEGKRNAIKAINSKIEFLNFVRKSKLNPSDTSFANWNYNPITGESIYNARFKTQREKTDYEKALRKEICDKKASLKDRKPFAFPSIHAPNQAVVGVFLEEKVRIVSVVDKDTLVVQLSRIAEDNYYHLTGLETTGFVDDSILTLDVPIVRNGTARAMASTVVSYRLITKEEAEELASMFRAIEDGEKIRSWESADRKHSTRAKLVGFDLKTVKLEKEDGEIAELPLAKLSKEDQSYVQRALGLEPMDVP